MLLLLLLMELVMMIGKSRGQRSERSRSGRRSCRVMVLLHG